MCHETHINESRHTYRSAMSHILAYKWVIQQPKCVMSHTTVLRLTYPTANVTVNKCTLGGLNGFDSDAEAWQTDLVGGLYTWEVTYRALFWRCMAFWWICRALLRIYRAILWTYRSLLWMCRALLAGDRVGTCQKSPTHPDRVGGLYTWEVIYMALLRMFTAFCRICRSLLWI